MRQINPVKSGQIIRTLTILAAACLAAFFMVIVTAFFHGTQTRVARAQASVTATKADTLAVDVNGNGMADPGDTLHYSIVINSNGDMDAENVAFLDPTEFGQVVTGSLGVTPIARDDTYVAFQNIPITVPPENGPLQNDSDPDGDTLILVPFSGPTANGGTAGVISGGGIFYIPPPDFTGSDTFTYEVEDTDGNLDSAQVTVDVIPVEMQDPPAAEPKGTTRTVAGLLSSIAAYWNPTLAMASGNSLTLTLGTLNPGQAVQIEFEVMIDEVLPPDTTELCNQAQLSGSFGTTVTDDPDTGASEDPTCTTIASAGPTPTPTHTPTPTPSPTPVAAPDLGLSIGTNTLTVSPGETLVTEIIYTNTGELVATGVTITSTLPLTTTFDSANSSPGWNCATGEPACTLVVNTVSGGGSGAATFAVTVNDPVPAGLDEISITIQITDDGANGTDPEPGNNTASVSTTLDAAPDLGIKKTTGLTLVAPGGPLTYTLEITNTGNQAATGVTITEFLPANTTFDPAASSAGWTCPPVGGPCLLSLGEIQGGGGTGEAVFAVLVDGSIPAGVDEIVNAAAIGDDGANGDDQDPGDNTVTVITPLDVQGAETLIYLSSSTSGRVDGAAFADEDILVHDPVNQSTSIYFDGSDVGLGPFDVVALVLDPETGTILMSFDRPIFFTDLGVVDDSDIVRFNPTSLGDNTAGSFELYFDGSDVGLSSPGEAIDALDTHPDGRLFISTGHTAVVPGPTIAQDEDILAFTPAGLGANTAGTWQLYFDGSDVGLDSPREDINGLSVDPITGQLYLSTVGNFSVPGLTGGGDDIFTCQPNTLGDETICEPMVFFLDLSPKSIRQIDAFVLID